MRIAIAWDCTATYDTCERANTWSPVVKGITTIQLDRISAMQAGCITINKSLSVAAAHVRIKHLKQYMMATEMIFQPFVAVVIVSTILNEVVRQRRAH